MLPHEYVRQRQISQLAYPLEKRSERSTMATCDIGKELEVGVHFVRERSELGKHFTLETC